MRSWAGVAVRTTKVAYEVATVVDTFEAASSSVVA